MGSRGLYFFKSKTTGTNKGQDGLIAPEDVILIKINSQWPGRGGTNTDVLKELIQTIVDHPDRFVGEIVVADNGQGRGSLNWSQNNAENIAQSTQSVVNTFSATYNVSTFLWDSIKGVRVNEYSAGDFTDGYILYNTPDANTGIRVSYPKFKTPYGTYISFKHGIWNGTGYEKRLKVINMPILKSHSSYGVTASLKHYMGVQSEGAFGQGGLGNGHASIATGGMGTLMVETGLPTLNIIDAIWVNANPPPSAMAGPSTPYDQATRVNVLIASTDPVAHDYWAAKNVLVQAASIIGYTDTHTLNPDNTDRRGVAGEAFGTWLDLTRDEIAARGYNVTTDEGHMNIYVKDHDDSTPPNIDTPSQNPPSDNVMPGDEVQVSVRVTDLESGVKNVTLSYRLNNGAWTSRPMDRNASTELYEASVPGQDAGTWVQFRIVAYDKAGNQATKGGVEPYYMYLVRPESPDTTPPIISVISPENKTYATNSISLTTTINEPTSWICYSLDGQANVTLTENMNLFGLNEGLHRIVFYAKDSAGNTGKSQEILFSINTSQPESEKEQLPPWLIALTIIAAVGGITLLGTLLTRANKSRKNHPAFARHPEQHNTEPPKHSKLR